MEINRPGNQLHGKAFENLVQKAHGCPMQYFQGPIDLPPFYDDYDIQMQVKTVHEDRDRIDCADASRFWHNEEPLHLLVACYRKVDITKEIYQIDEYLLGKSALKSLKGGIPSFEVERLHTELHSYERGEHTTARDYAHMRVRQLTAKYGVSAFMLNPKIDSKKQRRLQCSIRLRDLSPYLIHSYKENYRNIKLPIWITLEVND